MALSKDDKKEILELRGRLYSHRKIADRTEHSETTVRMVINEAMCKVIALVSDHLALDKIAERLGYPLTFVETVVAKLQTKSKKEPEARLEGNGKNSKDSRSWNVLRKVYANE